MTAIERAAARFCAAAIKKGDFATPPWKDHALHAEMEAALCELRAHDAEGELAFRSLLHHPSAYVRAWVGAELLSQGDESAVVVLSEIAANGDVVGFAAKMTLSEHAAGRLLTPFPGAA